MSDTPNQTADAVRQVVRRARAAQAIADGWNQTRVDEVVAAAAWAILEPHRNRELAELAVADTGVGNVDDKIRKNHRKTLGLLRDLHGMKTVDVIAEYPELGLVEIARPVGVVAAITPSTNPGATPANKILNALKARNAIVVAPSPKGRGTCAKLLEFIHAQFDRIDAPRDLVQMLPGVINKEATAALMREADLVVATGSQSNVRAAYTCGTPAFGVGAGNVAAIVDETADCEAAAERIVRSKTFDNATSCSSENSVVVVRAARDRLVAALAARGVVLLDDARKAALQQAMWPGGKLSGDVIGKSASEIAAVAGFDDLARRTDLRVLMVAESDYGPSHPFSGEKLSPVLALYVAQDFDDARRIVQGIYGYMGAGHSVGLHSAVDARALELGLRLPVARVIVNQAHCIATGGSFDNGLPFSLSMGCGTWGRNNFSDNMNVRHYMNVTRIARPIPERVPGLEDLLGTFFAKHGR
ncbi:MAG: aldehyde dehydrogenase family protein [Burkholderiaceae bacterium]|nr:aldehyde dehydrogenase family protein [Burkholderiaceae bacterium]ODS97207.1 MAG: sulfoacetaldehyde dehydrogenase [Lautropia sp. SCN 69-89]